MLSIHVRPWAYKESYSLNAQAESELNTDRIQAGRFYGSEGSGRVIYIHTKDETGKQMKDVFQYMKQADKSEIIVAREAHQQMPVAGERPQIHLYDGVIYQLMRSPMVGRDTVTRFEKLVYFTDNKTVWNSIARPPLLQHCPTRNGRRILPSFNGGSRAPFRQFC